MELAQEQKKKNNSNNNVTTTKKKKGTSNNNNNNSNNNNNKRKSGNTQNSGKSSSSSPTGKTTLAGNLIFRNGGTSERMRIDSSGQVGIGIITPTKELQVEGEISSSGTGHFANITLARTETIAVNNGNLYYTGGNLGIGTTDPTCLLYTSPSPRDA